MLIRENIFFNIDEINKDNIYNFLIKYIDRSNFDSKDNFFNNSLMFYLKLINKEKYQSLIHFILKVDEIEKKSNYEYTKHIIEMLNNNKFILKRTYFIKKFFEELGNNNLNNAEIYLEVIGCLEDIKEEHNLYKHYKKKLYLLNNIKLENLELNKEFLFLDEPIKKLRKEKGIAVLELEENKILKIHNYIKNNLSDINSFSIGEDNKKIVLSYVANFGKDTNNIFKEANTLYNEGRYNSAILLYKEIINRGKSQCNIYSFIGECYFKLNLYREALEYYEVAYDMARKANIITNYYEKISYIKSALESNKRLIRNNYEDIPYGIKEFNEIMYLILEERYQIEEICFKYFLKEEDINIIRLVCAIEEYRNSNYQLGDKILKSVERSKYKNKIIKRMFMEVFKNKMFYKNRPNDSIRKLIYKKNDV